MEIFGNKTSVFLYTIQFKLGAHMYLRRKRSVLIVEMKTFVEKASVTGKYFNFAYTPYLQRRDIFFIVGGTKFERWTLSYNVLIYVEKYRLFFRILRYWQRTWLPRSSQRLWNSAEVLQCLTFHSSSAAFCTALFVLLSKFDKNATGNAVFYRDRLFEL